MKLTDIFKKKPWGPVSQAIEHLEKTVAGARASGLYEKEEVFRALAVLLDHVSRQRLALEAAVPIVNELLKKAPDSTVLAKLIVSFQEKAVQARLHQYVPTKLYADLTPKSKPPDRPDALH